MITLQGKHCKDCVIFTDNVDSKALSLIYSFLNHPAWDGQKIRIMPDVHLGQGIVVGFVGTYTDYVNPEHIGGDIGCSISSYFTNFTLDSSKYPLLEHRIRKNIKFGFEIQDKKLYEDKELYKFINKEFSKYTFLFGDTFGNVNVDEKYITTFCKRVGISETNFYKSIGSVGSGNHFCEVELDSKGKIITTVHCGFRSLGQYVCKYWRNVAKTELPYNGYLTGENLERYFVDLIFTQAYAVFNHMVIHNELFNILNAICKTNVHPKFDYDSFVLTMHNYIDFTKGIIHKGSICSENGGRVVIPFNMRDGLAVCECVSNDEWMCSAPHGCGRKLSRGEAKRTLDLENFKKQMKQVVSTSVSASTIDEAPDAYKDKDEIISMIDGVVVNIKEFVKPVINCKSYTSNENSDDI
jgi:RNA-splicing ligase RtcB